jgi:hypothetical protein
MLTHTILLHEYAVHNLHITAAPLLTPNSSNYNPVPAPSKQTSIAFRELVLAIQAIASRNDGFNLSFVQMLPESSHASSS